MPAATGTGPNSGNYPEASLKSPELLLSFRERLLQNKHSLLVSSAKIRSMIKRDRTARYIYEQSKRDIERINGEIKDIEAKMMEIIESSNNLKDNYMPVSSVNPTCQFYPYRKPLSSPK